MSSIQNISVTAAQSYASVGSQSAQSLQPFADLNLTEAQRASMRAIFSAAKHDGTSRADVEKQLSAVLSPDQQRTLAGDMKAGRMGHRPAGSPPPEPAADTAVSTDAVASTDSTATASGATASAIVQNVQNQVIAAQSTLIDLLQKQVLGTNTTTEV